VWIPPDRTDALEEAQLALRRVYALSEDGGRRYDSFWDWVASREPDEPLAQLDSVAVEPTAQGRGIGSALIEFGLSRARADEQGVLLETGNPRNLLLYERHGFRVVDDGDAPDGGPPRLVYALGSVIARRSSADRHVGPPDRHGPELVLSMQRGCPRRPPADSRLGRQAEASELDRSVSLIAQRGSAGPSLLAVVFRPTRGS
jgi:GNAT superfamily N-acetyltransferase